MSNYQELPSQQAQRAGKPITMGTVLGVVLRKYATGKGRASRSEYWYFQAWQFIFFMLGSILYYFGFERIDDSTSVSALFLLGVFGFSWVVVAFIFAIPSVSVTIRRLHDSGKSAHYLWFTLLPVFGGIFSFVFMLQTPDRFANKYGGYTF